MSDCPVVTDELSGLLKMAVVRLCGTGRARLICFCLGSFERRAELATLSLVACTLMTCSDYAGSARSCPVLSAEVK